MRSSQSLKETEEKLSSLSYSFIVIKPEPITDQKALNQAAKIIHSNCSRISRIEFFLAPCSTIVRILNTIGPEKITRLTLVQRNYEFIGIHQFVSLPNLKYLETHQASGLLEMIRNHKIEILQIVHDYDYSNTVDSKIQRFLLTCTHLKDLLFENHFPALNVEELPFTLTNLTVSNIENRTEFFSTSQFRTLKNLLEANLDTLEFFLLGNFSGINGILEFLLPRAKKLKYLCLVCPTFTKIKDFTCNNQTVTNMAVTLARNCDVDLKKTRKIIANCVAVEKLVLTLISQDTSPLVNEAAQSLPNLKNLLLYNLTGIRFQHIPVLKNLEELFVERVKNQRDLHALVNLLMAAPNLRKLTVKLWGGERLAYLRKGRLQKILQNCQKLEEIFIGGLFRLPKSFVDGLLETESALRKLTIETYDMNLIRDNAKRLLNTKIQCTVIQWVQKRETREQPEYVHDDLLEEFFDRHANEDGSQDDTDVESSESEAEVDERFDELGQRRSKRLRLTR